MRPQMFHTSFSSIIWKWGWKLSINLSLYVIGAASVPLLCKQKRDEFHSLFEAPRMDGHGASQYAAADAATPLTAALELAGCHTCLLPFTAFMFSSQRLEPALLIRCVKPIGRGPCLHRQALCRPFRLTLSVRALVLSCRDELHLPGK